MRTGEASSIWTTYGNDQHLIKLEKGRDGGKDDREWIFGEQAMAASLTAYIVRPYIAS